MPVRYDQDTKDHHRKENHGWLPHGIKGALQRGMERVMYTAAGLLSGAPPDEHPRCHPGRRIPPGADRRRRGQRR